MSSTRGVVCPPFRGRLLGVFVLVRRGVQGDDSGVVAALQAVRYGGLWWCVAR